MSQKLKSSFKLIGGTTLTLLTESIRLKALVNCYTQGPQPALHTRYTLVKEGQKKFLVQEEVIKAKNHLQEVERITRS